MGGCAETTVQRASQVTRLQCHLELRQLSRASNAKPRVVILTAGAVVNLAQARNAAFLGVIQGGSGIPIGACP